MLWMKVASALEGLISADKKLFGTGDCSFRDSLYGRAISMKRALRGSGRIVQGQ